MSVIQRVVNTAEGHQRYQLSTCSWQQCICSAGQPHPLFCVERQESSVLHPHSCRTHAAAQVARRNKDGSTTQIAYPESIKLYSCNMGGVHLFESRRKTYSCSRKSKKWWLRLIYSLLDTAVVSSYTYVLHSETPRTRKLSLKDFVILLVDKLMSSFSSRSRATAKKLPTIAKFLERQFPDLVEEPKQCFDCSRMDPVPLCPIKCFRI